VGRKIGLDINRLSEDMNADPDRFAPRQGRMADAVGCGLISARTSLRKVGLWALHPLAAS
jgi:hypothetical protein